MFGFCVVAYVSVVAHFCLVSITLHPVLSVTMHLQLHEIKNLRQIILSFVCATGSIFPAFSCIICLC